MPPTNRSAAHTRGTSFSQSAGQSTNLSSRESLKSHPDRVPADSPERPERTRKFQEINDAYYTLSDPTRRREYDEARAYAEAEEEVEEEAVPPGGFPWSSFGFGSREREERDTDQFGTVFEEMLREEGMASDEDGRARPTSRFWAVVGGVSGGAIGFIAANLPGLWLVPLLGIVSGLCAMPRAKVSMRFSWTYRGTIGRDC